MQRLCFFMCLLVLLLSTAAGCGGSDEAERSSEEDAPLFALLPADSTGVRFANQITERPGLNVLAYEYFFNGGGVAVGDVDGNGLPDLYFTANMGPNALYLNRGGLRFEEATRKAGVQGRPGWTTGVAMADVNGDGRLDLYVSKSGRLPPERRRNELFINNGDGTFSERAADFGLDDPSYSTQATFFDYDRDGDLDVYLANHPIERFSRFDVGLMRSQRDPYAGDKLYRNEGDTFVDVSEEAGIKGNPIGFALSATASDIDKDGWPDLYVANDYVEDDYLYLNNGDGTFREAIREHLAHTSHFSMGADIADVNNDARPDVFTLDMLPETNRRQKLLKGPDTYDRHQMMTDYGYHHQYMRNMLHVSTETGRFSEIGQLAGVSNTDWSWAALLADYDLDGFKDLFVTNGYMRDYTNLDFLHYTIAEAKQEAAREGRELDLYALVRQMPSTDLHNYIFRNRGDLTFAQKTAAWGLDQVALSNGAAYGDLDADGDLDLVVNNINKDAFIYRNDARERGRGHYLTVRLEGEGGNRFGIGAKVELTADEGQTAYQELFPTRGFQSSVEPVLLFGLPSAQPVSLQVTWPDGTRQSLSGVAVDQTLTLHQAEARQEVEASEEQPAPLLARLPDGGGLTFAHEENAFVDFKREPLLPHMLSRLGPALTCADVNRDGMEDVFVGGAQGQPAALFLQQIGGAFKKAPVEVFDAHRAYEDVDAAFFDADGDGDQDLYVVSGGYAETEDLSVYQDRLYLNNGFGAFTHAAEALPAIESSGGAVAAHDYDGDGDEDLFVGGRVLPGEYPYAPRSYLLENTGGRFADVAAQASDRLTAPGMITDALWHDVTGDGAEELILAGEWMPLRVFRRESGGTFAEITDALGLAQTNGWWHALAAADLDGDGDADLVAGNRGTNAQMQATPEAPASIYAADFDENGSVDPIMSYYLQGENVPVPARDELLDRMPSLRKRFTTYASYAQATMDDLFPDDRLGDALHLKAYTFATSVFENEGGTFSQQPLPVAVQAAPVRDLVIYDVDRDGVPDVLLAGNDFTVRAQWGRADAGHGVLLRGQGGSLSFEVLRVGESGFFAPGDVRRLALVETPPAPLLIVANNGGPLAVFALPIPAEVAAR